MAYGQSKAISMQGMVHNASKIGVQDGMMEDIVNLRFKDGSWRTSGDGKHVFSIGTTDGKNNYTQLFIHTNVYRHLLGVKDGALYWFANIDKDGVFEGIEPVKLLQADDNLTIEQTGNLITIVCKGKSFDYFVFKTNKKEYIKVVTDNEGVGSRSSYPFGLVNFNWHTEKTNNYVVPISTLTSGMNLDKGRLDVAIKEMKKRNKFHTPLIVFAAIKLYDGSYAFPSAPVLLNAGDRRQIEDGFFWWKDDFWVEAEEGGINECKIHRVDYPGFPFVQKNAQGGNVLTYVDSAKANYPASSQRYSTKDNSMIGNVFPNNRHFSYINAISYTESGTSTPYIMGGFYLQGYDIAMSLTNKNLLRDNEGIFDSLCVFVCPIDSYETTNKPFSVNGNSLTGVLMNRHAITISENLELGRDLNYQRFSQKMLDDETIKYNIENAIPRLLVEYNRVDLEKKTNPIIDLSGKKYEGIVSNLEQQDIFSAGGTNRKTYLPNVVYSYNGRLHIADYVARQFEGYPIDLYHLNNHSVKFDKDSKFKGVLESLASDFDDEIQYSRERSGGNNIYDMGDNSIPSMIVRTTIDTSDGDQVIARVIYSGDNTPTSWIEKLGPLLTFPDSRAKKIEIYIAYGFDQEEKIVSYWYKECPLTMFNYLDAAFFMNTQLSPIDFNLILGKRLDDWMKLGENINETESYPNGLKVSNTDNPMYFPAKNTYQVGSSEIVALCANSIAVGTGQTGQAPLYVFCKDGVYALFVDASGEMTYTNARVLARDVCNNAKSVTPIDDGVVFTTDRGLMLIAGEQVQEIGQPLEGDFDKASQAAASGKPTAPNNSYHYVKFADLPGESDVHVDFLQYLKGAIINSNHNEFELMVSNPNYGYSYVLDKNHQWSRRAYSADEYVNNFPSSYRLKAGELYQVDKGSDADNGFYAQSNVIKLDSIGFKELKRVVVRGFFRTISTKSLFDDRLTLPEERYNISYLERAVTIKNFTISCEKGDQFVLEAKCSRIRDPRVNNEGIRAAISVVGEDGTVYVREDVTASYDQYYYTFKHQEHRFTISNAGNIRVSLLIYVEHADDDYEIYYECLSGGRFKFVREFQTYIRLLIEGSYDGRGWAIIGEKHKTGVFNDIGCNVSRTDCKFYRFILAGQLQNDSRLDFVEFSALPSRLDSKPR